MTGLPPGTILQLMYLRERIKSFSPNKRFLDIGSGNGMLTSLLLSCGMTGVAIDLNQSACENNRIKNKKAIIDSKLNVIHQDLLQFPDDEKFDVICASMVIEHLPENILTTFIEKCKSLLKPQGKIIFLVPGSMKYWGIEDEIAGHVLRYESKDIQSLANRFNLQLVHEVGLTYPISNWLFWLSNRIIKKNESEKLNLSELERTIYTGNRNVSYKTTFPRAFNIILNSVSLFPLYLLQKVFLKSPNCMIKYMELTK